MSEETKAIVGIGLLAQVTGGVVAPEALIKAIGILVESSND
jgi:hypothetical protein